ncbi:DUF1501 domain-containing protein [Gimesia maris]|uniref:DUF1501 domain-containing protein n=1 Tax=Gimesia maris TaxID=122 RepID=UPI00241F2CD9|nr:DUF1501 domain-containing protein [Gimesia maris]|tara:strand:- start:18221 stop:19570 length:1350 start_codon:yes stop_codon:yes gene_type:complete
MARNLSDCSGVTRRNFVQAGLLGAGGLGLADLMKLKAEASISAKQQDTNVILFWLSGGPGHMETWDPKPDAPADYRGPFQSIATSLSDVRFGELMPEQAKLAEHLAVLRTVNHGSGDHTKGNHWMLTGFEGPAFNAPDNRVQRRPSMGSAASFLRGANQAGMPPYVGVPHLKGGTDNLFHYSSYIGGGSNPFIVNSDPNTSSFSVHNLTLTKGLSFDRLQNRRQLLGSLDTLPHAHEKMILDVDEHQQKAFELLNSKGVRSAFDISAEPAALRDSYGRHTFGQSALLARRLIEHGVTFVTVNCVPWDHHGSAGRYKTEEGARKLIPPLDAAIAGLIRDLMDRGLYEKTLVVAMGEFGRTPRMNIHGGRDHWGRTFSVLMGCGGMKMGQVIGRSSRYGETVVERPISPQDVAATIYRHLGIDPQKVMLQDRLDRPLPLLDDGEAVSELFA